MPRILFQYTQKDGENTKIRLFSGMEMLCPVGIWVIYNVEKASL